METPLLIAFLFFCWLWMMSIIAIYFKRQIVYDQAIKTLSTARERLKAPFPHEFSEHSFKFGHPIINVEEYHVTEKENLLTYCHLGKNISVLSDTEQ